MNDIIPEIQEAPLNHKQDTYKEITPNHIIKVLKTKEKEQILKAATDKKIHCIYENNSMNNG